MKKNDWVLLISVALYSFLFYHQAAGINFLLFNIAVISGSAIKNPGIIRNKNWIITAAGSVISSACIMIYSSPLAIITNILSLGIFSVMSFSPATSVFVSLILTLCSAGSSIVFMFLDMIKRRRNSIEKENKKPFYVKVVIFLIVLVITILFFVMYQTSNPLFKDFTKNINLDFISAAWIFFTLGGLLLLYGFYYNRHLGFLTSDEGDISNNLDKEKVTSSSFLNRLFREDTELLTGVILFSVLNLMLLVLNVLDLNYLWFDGKLPEGMQHKEFVHDGVGTLILSVLCAIFIILYFFRGRLNYSEKSKTIKILAYIWIIQNAFMIFSTAFRMNMYINESGISYKKIGVYVYLGLTLIGLITTYIKVAKNKTNWFLFRVNPQVYYAIMVISCTVNWDVFITGFNIDKALKENKKLEKYYLADLSFKNIPQLLSLNDTIKNYDDYDARDYYFASRGTYFSSFKSALDKKLFEFLDEYYKYSDWRSYCSEKNRVYEEIMNLNEKNLIQSLELSNNYSINSLVPIRSLNNIKELNIGQCAFKRLSELSAFPHLKNLTVSGNQIDSLHLFPVLKELKFLDISDNAATGWENLKNAPDIERLNAQNNGINSIHNFPPLSKLADINLYGNPIDDFSGLSNYPELTVLNIGNTFRGNLDTVSVLPKLQELNISENQITAANSKSILAQFFSSVGLKTLNVSGNEIGNVYALINENSAQSVFPVLESLTISNNKLYTLAGIGVLTQLHTLQAGNNNINDIDPVLKLRNLKVLSLEYNPLVNIEGIEQLTLLEYLNVGSCNLRTGLTSLSVLQNLTDLNISGNHISNLAPVYEIKSLKRLNLTDNNIKSLKGIEKLQNLEELFLTQNQVTDFLPLASIKNLKTVYTDVMSAEQMKKLRKALPDCRINDIVGTESMQPHK